MGAATERTTPASAYRTDRLERKREFMTCDADSASIPRAHMDERGRMHSPAGEFIRNACGRQIAPLRGEAIGKEPR